MTIDGLTISNGNGGLNAGGGINNLSSGTVNVTNSTISGNQLSPSAAAFYTSGPVNITNSTISGNSSLGGGILAGLGTTAR